MAVGKNTLPVWLCKHLNSQDLTDISESVRQGELKTRGELVPVIVRRSVPIGGVIAPSILFFIALFGFLERHYFEPYEPWSMILALAAAAVIGYACSRIEAVQRFILPDADENKAAQERAELEFFREGIHQTQEKTGILIFISLLERRVVILADEGISKKLPADIWAQVVKQLIEDIHRERLKVGLTRAIETCANLLSEHFPRENSKDQLRNDLVIKE